MNTYLILLNALALSAVIGLSQFGGVPDQIVQINHSPALTARQAVMGGAPEQTQVVSSDRLSF
ncbi:hypothetical protein PS627_02630 [Pseudomonas fluorescens]|nr:hypothetical protein PS627_02630 [Pseudomonas fluorescens]VVP81877.1 hypothetical protein PS910_02040 [Pseudomonas fluorescens]